MEDGPGDQIVEPIPLALADGQDLMGKATQDLEQALEFMAPVEKVAYDQALYRAPHLIESESDRKRFLALEQFNGWNAASRLVTYWDQRKKAFGDAAFCLPLTLDGKGAFSPKALHCIQQGSAFCFLQGKTGNDMVFTDQSQFVGLSLEERLQLLFYICFKCMNNSQSQTEGFVWISCRSTANFLSNFKAMFHVFRSAMPVIIQSFHIIQKRVLKMANEGNDSNDPITIPLVNSLTANNILYYNHRFQSPDELVEQLLSSGYFDDDILEKFLWFPLVATRAQSTKKSSSPIKTSAQFIASTGTTNQSKQEQEKLPPVQHQLLLSPAKNIVEEKEQNQKSPSLQSLPSNIPSGPTFSGHRQQQLLPSQGNVSAAAAAVAFNNPSSATKQQAASTTSIHNSSNPSCPSFTGGLHISTVAAVATTTATITTHCGAQQLHRQLNMPKITSNALLLPSPCAAPSCGITDTSIRNSDILLGRGSAYTKHPGNVWLQRLIQSHVGLYETAASRTQIKQLKHNLLTTIKRRDGRFMERTNDEWVEVADSYALEKIGQAFRNLRLKIRVAARQSASSGKT